MQTPLLLVVCLIRFDFSSQLHFGIFILLQIHLSEASRITTDPTTSEFEDMHEFDTSYAMDGTWTTTSNIE